MNLGSKRIMTTIALAALGGTALALASASAASAHTPEVESTCTTLTVTLTNYSTSNENAKPNTVTVSIDDQTVEESTFGAGFTDSYTFDDKTVAHHYEVTIDSVDNAYDRTFSGDSEPCLPPAPPVLPNNARAELSTTPAACGVAGTLVLGAVKNAEWGTPTATTGPANYSVTATATEGHVFGDGEPSMTLTGTLEGALDTTVAPCATPPASTPPVATVTVPASPTGQLAETGLDAGSVVGLAGGLAAAGGLALALLRLRSRLRS
jgi:hypothetical protein